MILLPPCVSMFRVNDISFFCQTTVTSIVFPPCLPPPLSTPPPVLWALIGGSITGVGEEGGDPAVNYNKTTTSTSGKKRNNNQQTNKQTSFSIWVNLTPGSLPFWLHPASKDCLQSLPWYAHVDILTITWCFFFFLFIFSFFLWFVNLFKIWNKDLY